MHFAVVAHGVEVKAMTEAASVREAARQVLGQSGADIVVVKRGGLEALVLGADGREVRIGSFANQHVWPIGSGDVFSAVFA